MNTNAMENNCWIDWTGLTKFSGMTNVSKGRNAISHKDATNAPPAQTIAAILAQGRS